MTPAGQGTWTCLEDAAPTRTWTCSGETGLGQGTWTWTQRDAVAWDGWPPDILPKKRAMSCSGGTSDRYLLRCNFYPTGESPVSFIEYLYTGDVNYPRTTATGDAGFGYTGIEYL